MQTEQLLSIANTALEDMKARDVELIDVQGNSSVTDFMLIASGTSRRHVLSIASEVTEKVKEQGVLPIGTEGERDGDWVLVDLGSVVVHVMMPDARDFYALEKLWRFDAPADKAESQ